MLANGAGILVEVRSRDLVVNDFREAIILLYQDPVLRRAIGIAARRRVEQQFLWEKRRQNMNGLYNAVITNRGILDYANEP